MFLIALAHAAPIDIVLDGTITAGEIDSVDVSGPAIFRVTMDDTTEANEFGVFLITSTGSIAVELEDTSYLIDDTWSLLASVMTGDGFVNVQALIVGLDIVLGESYDTEPTVVFGDGDTLVPFGAHELIDDGGAFLNTEVSFDGATSDVTTDLEISLWRMRVEYPDFVEDTIEADYGADIIDPSFPVHRQPATIAENLDYVDGELTAAGCFVDRGDVFAGSYKKQVVSGDGMLGGAATLTQGSNAITGTLDGLAATGVYSKNLKTVVSTSAGLYAGYFERVSGRNGFWYVVPTTGCDTGHLEGWYGKSLSSL